MSNRIAKILLILLSCGAILGAGCADDRGQRALAPKRAAQLTPSAAPNQEQPLPAESNPPGDIPDTQAFVKYRSLTGGCEIDTPEGWARKVAGGSVVFSDKYDGEKVTVVPAKAAPVALLRAPEVQAIEKLGRAVRIASIRRVQLPSGSAVLVDFASNSEPNSVTGKRVRLENNSYLFFKTGRLVSVTLWAPLGADNVDQWLQIARSFRWT